MGTRREPSLGSAVTEDFELHATPQAPITILGPRRPGLARGQFRRKERRIRTPCEGAGTRIRAFVPGRSARPRAPSQRVCAPRRTASSRNDRRTTPVFVRSTSPGRIALGATPGTRLGERRPQLRGHKHVRPRVWSSLRYFTGAITTHPSPRMERRLGAAARVETSLAGKKSMVQGCPVQEPNPARPGTGDRGHGRTGAARS